MIELLSPAGNFEKLKIALEYGADALYGGVSHFSLRSRSGKEFTYESFQEAIEYVHSKDKKIYATVNGFPFNSQIELLKNHIKKLASFKPDAFIVSTVGVIQLAKEIAPEIELHLSTQANVLNYLDATAYYDMGVKRIIVAREIGLNDLKVIKERVPELELEIFVHGSMCFAYSGRCLISSVQSGRVPNRGSCANDCRFDYKLFAKNKKTDELLEIEENEIYVKSPEHNSLFRIEEYRDGSYIMNAKDLNLSGYIDEILESGVVDSIKIEGRTKSPYYTAITTKTYREAVDDFSNGSFDKLKYQRELDTLKNRGYSDSYIVSKPSERTDTQNLEFALSDGSYQVEAIISEDGEKFFCQRTSL
jgi:putative protease